MKTEYEFNVGVGVKPLDPAHRHWRGIVVREGTYCVTVAWLAINYCPQGGLTKVEMKANLETHDEDTRENPTT